MADSKMTDTTSSQDFDETTRYFGRVKWFNNKAGYGFGTIVGDEGGDRVGEDIFVHHTGVQVGSEQYKYLVQGEYVHFTLRGSDSSAHPYQAANLTGPYGGQLMCETRNEQRQQRADKEDSEGGEHGSRNQRRPHQRGRTVRLQGSGPREGETWTLVKEDNNRRGGRNGGNRRSHGNRQGDHNA
jgi:cold shock CspA family protein